MLSLRCLVALSALFVHTTATLTHNSSICCAILSSTLGNAVSYPLSLTYINEQIGQPTAGYWTTQESDLTPTCRVTPTSAQQVAAAVKIAASFRCKFAVRSGGHTTFAGAANIGSDGFTIDLSSLDSVVVSADNKTVAVGSGARWIEVYTVLDPLGLSIAGGREAPVGVGGLTLGGGKSFFSDKVGFVCDGLASVEIITASGITITASATSYPSLFRAIKGGSNNFGIITTFHFNTFQQASLWGGFKFDLGLTSNAQFAALQNYLAAPANESLGVEAIIAYVNLLAVGELFTNYFTNIVPNPTPPPVLDEFVAIQPSLTQTFRVANLSSLANELSTGQSSGNRFAYGTFTINSSLADVDYYNTSFNTFRSMFEPLFATAVTTMNTMAWQKLSSEMLSHGCNTNSLGLCPSSPDAAPLVLVNFGVTWELATSDSRVYAVCEQFLAAMETLAKERGVYHPYVYLNYALQTQDPFTSYGAQNLRQLRQTSHMIDPAGVFRNLVPGGFKLW